MANTIGREQRAENSERPLFPSSHFPRPVVARSFRTMTGAADKKSRYGTLLLVALNVLFLSVLLTVAGCADAPGRPITCNSVIRVEAMEDPHFSCVPVEAASNRTPVAHNEAAAAIAALNRE